MVAFRSAYRLLIPLAFLGYAGFYLLVAASPFYHSLQLWVLDGKSWGDGTATKAFDDAFSGFAPHQITATDAAGALRYALYGELKPGALRGRDGYLFAEADLIFFSEVNDRVDFALGQIGRVDAMLDARGIDLIFLPLPTKMDVERDHHDHLEAAEAGEAAFSRLVAGARRLGIPTVDARRAWMDKSELGNLTHRTDQHWTVHGAATAAQAVANMPELRGKKRSEGLISLRVSTETLAFQGDLARFIGRERVSAQAGYPVEVIRPLQAVYSDDVSLREPAFTLVGTSESVDQRWSFAALLEAELQGRVDNKAMSGLGPLYPMWQAIRQMDVTSPRTVIWEFPVGAIFKDSEIYVDNALP